MSLQPTSVNSSLKAQSGQVVIETVLLIALLVGLSMFLTKALRDYELPKKLVLEPWGRLDGMIQCGTWQSCGRSTKSGGAAKEGAHVSISIISLDTANE